MDEVEGALEVHGDDGVPLSLGHAEHEAVFGDTGIVDQDVDAAEVFDNLGDDGLGLGEVGGIGGIAFAFHAADCYLFLGLLAVFVDDQVSESYVGAFGGEFQCECFADTTGGAGDEGGFSFKKFHILSVCLLVIILFWDYFLSMAPASPAGFCDSSERERVL